MPRFAAEPAQVRKLLLQLASLRTVEAKTSSPERYARLGVADIGSGSGGDTGGAAGGRGPGCCSAATADAAAATQYLAPHSGQRIRSPA